MINEPLRRVASTTRVPSDKPAMIRLRCGKCAFVRLDARRVFRHEQPALGDRGGEVRMLARIDRIEPAAEHGDRASDLGERAAMARAVDTDRESARDREAARGEIARELLRVVAAAARRVAAAYDRELRAGEQRAVLALHPQRERSVGELREQRRVVLAAVGHEAAASGREPRA